MPSMVRLLRINIHSLVHKVFVVVFLSFISQAALELATQPTITLFGFSCFPFREVGLQECTTLSTLFGIGDQTQFSVHAKQAL